jgi:geranylgeranyl diphosphate synthase type I
VRFEGSFTMKLEPFYEIMLPVIESSLQHAVAGSFRPKLEEMHRMLEYHMGWEGEGAGPEARGKRIRPLLVLLSAASAGGDWEKALPGAAAVELIHNFSLVHDDIQDQSPTRRGRTTLWTRWGVAQAINAGDALFSLAQTALLELADTVSLPAALSASRALNETCLSLTQGQFLDLAYEDRQDLSIEDYWPMVAGKTAALISSCTYIGALAAQVDPKTCEVYRKFGELLGLAFQVQDDLLGIWGDARRLGKSTASDLVSGKKSLPVLYGLGLNGDFARRWMRRGITEEEVPGLALQLEAEGGHLFGEQQADRLTKEALAALTSAYPQGEAGEALCELAEYLLKRKT